MRAFLFLSLFFPCYANSLAEMTIDEKIGQLLIVHFNGEEVNEDAKNLIQKVHVGGFIYYNWANGLHSPSQVTSLSFGLQELARQTRTSLPLFISIDQEGGVVSRLTTGFTVFPGNQALGKTKDETLAKQAAFAMGEEMRAVGVNFNFSPVVDINTNPDSPIGLRAFGDSPSLVISFAKNTLQGYEKARIMTALKHFPGLGDVEVDAHQELPIIKKSKQELQQLEFLPFAQLCDYADSIITSHVLIPDLDPIYCATLSKKILDLLRKEIAFSGLIIADSLVMEGLLKNCASVDEAALLAINAGCDMLILGGKQLIGSNANFELTVRDVERMHRFLVEQVKKGELREERVNQAVERILALKNKHNFSFENGDFCHLNTHSHKLLAKKIASLALEIKKNKEIPPLDRKKIAIFAPKIVEKDLLQSFPRLGKEPYFFFHELNPSEMEIQNSKKIAKKIDVLIVFSYDAWQNNQQKTLISALLNEKKTSILVILKEPRDALLFPQADMMITTFSPTIPSFESVFEYLF